MSFGSKSARPPSILGDSNVRTTRASVVYPTQTVGSYTSWKQPVRLATTTNVALSGLQTLDGVQLVNNDRILVKNQTNAVENGIYIVQSTVNAVYFWQRSNDLQDGSSSANIAVFVNEGNVGGGRMYICTNMMNTDIVGVNSLVFAQFSGGGGGGGGSPAGDNYDIQYNREGEFGGSSLLQFYESQEPSSPLPLNVIGKITLGVPVEQQSDYVALVTAANATSELIAGGTIVISGGYSDQSVSGSDGGEVIVCGGYSAFETGGNTTVKGGSGINGGSTSILGGPGSSGSGGFIDIIGGISDSNAGGDVVIQGGLSTTGYGGEVAIQGGYSNTDGGSIYIHGGNSVGIDEGNIGGSIEIVSGSCDNGETR